MKTESENLSADQSLEIITEMIRQAKGNARDNTFYFLLWGWVIVLANLGVFTLMRLGNPYPYLVWGITIPVWIFSMYWGYKRRSVARPATLLDKISGWLWIWYGLAVFTLVFFGYKINYQLTPVILVITSIPTFVSGVMLKFKPLMMGAMLFWALGIVSFLVPQDIQLLVSAAAIAGGYLVPGYMLKAKQED